MINTSASTTKDNPQLKKPKIWYFNYNSLGAITGIGISQDSFLPGGTIQCTQEQASSSGNFLIDVSKKPNSIVIKGNIAAIEMAKKIQIDLINSDHLSAQLQPVVINKIPYDITHNSQRNITSVMVGVLSGNISFPIKWRDANNKTQTLSKIQFLNMASAALSRVQEIYYKSFVLKDEITAVTTTPDDVRKIVW